MIRHELEKRIDSEIRTTVLGHIQRGGTPTPFDRVLATKFGCYAASLVATGQWGRMVALQDNRLTSVELDKVANQTKLVQRDSMAVASALGIGASFGCKDLGVDVNLKSLGDNKLAL